MEHIQTFKEFLFESGFKEGEKIPGGLSDNMSIEDIADHHKVDIAELKSEYQLGKEVEAEHTSDVGTAAEIARDHLYEDPKYYTKLATIEDE